MYGHPVYFAETFIDPTRFRGTCYRAAHWQFLGLTTGRGKNDHTYKPNRPLKEVLGLPLTPHFRELLRQEAMAKSPQSPLEINLEEIYRILDSARRQPMSEAASEKVQTAVAALAEKAAPQTRTTEKTRAVLPNPNPDEPAGGESAGKRKPTKPGHGRHGAAQFTRAKRITVTHAALHSGDTCPECQKGKVYCQKNPKTLIRITGRRPLEATAYELEQLRCNGCGQVFTAEAPAEAGDPHVRAQQSRFVRLSHGVATARGETQTEPVGVDAVELPRGLGLTVDARGCVIE